MSSFPHLRTTITFVMLLFCAVASQAEKASESGYVTAVRPDSSFDLNGHSVLIGSKTHVSSKKVGATQAALTQQGHFEPFVGEFLEVHGAVDRQTRAVEAASIETVLLANDGTSGLGIIDALPTQTGVAEGRLVRADGYQLLIPAKANVTFAAPLTAASPLTTNLWIRYHGLQREDGVVVLDRAEISANTVNHTEDKLRTKSDYDPSQIDEGDAQGGASKAFFGVDRKRIPASQDTAMQTRIEKIGNSLVPAYQKALLPGDSTRIDFRFQVVDLKKHNDAMSMGSGVILVPQQVVERLQNDSQVAAILADSIAEVLEKQDFRVIPANHKLTAVNLLGDAAGIVVPGAGLATGLGTYAAGKKIESHQMQQSGRVSLCLMHDAGYDIIQAPVAWWTLKVKQGKDLAHTDIPTHALYLYEDLGTTWRNTNTQASVTP